MQCPEFIFRWELINLAVYYPPKGILMKLRNIVVLCLSLTIIACSSGKKAYEHGDYYDAVLQSIKRLRQKPDHQKSAETLKNSYPLAVEYLEGQANNEIAANSPF